jgi:hypothetical protein
MLLRTVERVRIRRSQESILGTKLLEKTKRNKCCGKDSESVITLIVHLSLLLSRGDQIVTDNEEKKIPLLKQEIGEDN